MLQRRAAAQILLKIAFSAERNVQTLRVSIMICAERGMRPWSPPEEMHDPDSDRAETPRCRRSEVKSVLILKLGALGDVVMASALLPALRKQWPDVEIVWLAGGAAAALLRLLREPPRIMPVDDKALLQGSRLQKIREVLRVNRLLAGRHFDLCLVPYRDRRYHALRLGARCDVIRSFAAAPAAGRNHPSDCEAYLRLALGESAPPRIECPQLADLPPLQEPAPDVLLVPGGAHNLLADDAVRRWPAEHYAALAKMLLQEGRSVGLIGDAGDMAALEVFSGLNVQSFIGRTTLAELLALLSATRVLVTHDTGPMHLMRLTGRPTVALFGPTPPFQSLEALPNFRIVQAPEPLSCRPCYDGKGYADCAHAACMRGITPQAVFAALSALPTMCTKPR